MFRGHRSSSSAAVVNTIVRLTDFKAVLDVDGDDLTALGDVRLCGLFDVVNSELMKGRLDEIRNLLLKPVSCGSRANVIRDSVESPVIGHPEHQMAAFGIGKC